MLVSTEERTLLGVHVFGTNAADLVHIGQAIMACGGTVDYLVDTVLNYPTLSEAYKVAALDVTNKIRALDAGGGPAASAGLVHHEAPRGRGREPGVVVAAPLRCLDPAGAAPAPAVTLFR